MSTSSNTGYNGQTTKKEENEEKEEKEEQCPSCSTTDPKQHLRGCTYFHTYILVRCHEKCPKGPFCPNPQNYPGGIHHGGYTSCYQKGCGEWSITGRCWKHQY